MTYTVTTESRIYTVDNLGSFKQELELPLTEIKGLSPLIFPISIPACIDAGVTKTFDLSFTGGKLILFAFKSSRAVIVTLVTSALEYPLPPSEYFHYLVAGKENAGLSVTSVKVQVPAAIAPAPNPLPSQYPKANISMYALLTAS